MRIPRWGYWLSTIGIWTIAVAVLNLGDIALLAWVIILPSYLCIAAARSRDMGKSPWYCLTTLIPIYGWWAFLWLGIARSHAAEAEEATAEEHKRELFSQPETPQSGAQPNPWEEKATKKPTQSILVGVGGLLLVAAITLIAFSLTDNEPTADSNTFLDCDTWLRQQLVSSPKAAANAENANAVVAYVQSQRPDSCPPGTWNPLVTNVTRDHEGNIDVTFSTLPGQARGIAVTMPADGTPRWVYLVTDSQWYSSTIDAPQIWAAPPTSSPLPPPTYTPRPATTARLVPTHTTAPPHPTATSPPVPTPTPVSVKDIYVEAFSSCGGQHHGEEKSRRRQAATLTLKAGLQSLDALRATIEQNCANAIESAAARLGATPSPTATSSLALALQRNPTPTPAPSPVSTDRPTPTHYRPTPPTTATNTYQPRTGEITTSLGQRVHVNVSGFNDIQMRFDQLVQIINETERLLGIPYPAPAVTMLQVSNLDDGFCGNNHMSYATRYVDDSYVVENSVIKVRVDAECNKTFATISHEVAHTWFYGNGIWIDEGVANAIKYQLLATYRPDQAIYPPVTYCQTYRNISTLESATPKRENKDEHAGFSCNYRLGDGIMGALRQHHGDRGFNSRIAQLARQREASSKRAYDITDIRKTLGDTSPALTTINHWYQGNPQMRRYRHLDAIEWVSPPIIDGQYLHFAGRIGSEGTIFEPILGKTPYCSQFVLREEVNGTDYVASLADPLAVGWTYDETPEATIINESINSATGYFEATAKLNDHSIAGRNNLTLLVKSRVTTEEDGYCKTATNYAQVEVEQGSIPEQLKLVKHYHQNEIDWLTEPRLQGNNILLSGAANPGTLTLHPRNGYCGQLHVYHLTEQGYIYVDNVATILPEDQHWTETPDFEATGWHENSNGTFNAVVKVRNNALDGLGQPILVVQTPARFNEATNQCGESENIAAVDIMR